MKSLVTSIRQAPIEPGMPLPRILIVVPPSIQTPKGPIAPKFEGGEHKCLGLAKEYETVANEMNCLYFDSSLVTSSSNVDGIHLDIEQHHALGKAIGKLLTDSLGRDGV
jgi:hypothetical protein